MKLLTEHLGETIVALAIVCLLITSIALFATPVKDFFSDVVESAFASKPSEPDNGGTPVVPPESACEHTNKETQNAKAATCTEDGSTGKVVCLDCGNTITSASVIPATGHQNTEVRNASETYSGDTYCLDCGVKVSSGHVIDASCEHTNTEITGAVEATCTEAGSTGDEVCVDCGVTVNASTSVPSLGHDWGEWTYVDDSDTGCVKECNRCGATEKYAHRDDNGDGFCDDCDGEVSSEPVACSHSNTEIRDATSAEESNAGYTTGGYHVEACSDCGEILNWTKHNYDNIVITTEPTCTTAGAKTVTCSGCGGWYNAEVAATGHTEGKWEYYDEDYCREVCPDCGTQIASQSHQWEVSGGGLKSATCTEDGVGYMDCPVCGAQGEFIVPATGHQNTEIRNASETYTGDKYCLDCGELISSGAVIGSACSHSDTTTLGYEPTTCRRSGYTGDVYCLDCESIISYGYRSLGSLPHEFTDPLHPLRCVNCGYHKTLGYPLEDFVITP